MTISKWQMINMHERYMYNDDKYDNGCLKINDNTISWQENKSLDK